MTSWLSQAACRDTRLGKACIARWGDPECPARDQGWACTLTGPHPVHMAHGAYAEPEHTWTTR